MFPDACKSIHKNLCVYTHNSRNKDLFSLPLFSSRTIFSMTYVVYGHAWIHPEVTEVEAFVLCSTMQLNSSHSSLSPARNLREISKYLICVLLLICNLSLIFNIKNMVNIHCYRWSLPLSFLCAPGGENIFLSSGSMPKSILEADFNIQLKYLSIV